MKYVIKSVLVSVLIATMGGNAVADSGHPGRPPHAYHHYHGSGNLDWLGAILLFGFTAAVVNAMTTQPPAPPPATYDVPPVPAPQVIPQPAQTGMWYYCRSTEQYYPYVRTCPEEWEMLPPIPPQ